MPFFTYSQNNSGGSFDYDQSAGIGEYVIVEADDAKHADYRAERIGLYFDGSGDCSCCGSRWSPYWPVPGDDVPSIYRTPVDMQIEYRLSGGKFAAFVHHADGTITNHLGS